MEVFNWALDLVAFFGSIWNWLNTPLLDFGNGLIVAPIGIFSVGILAIILVAKVIALVIPN